MDALTVDFILIGEPYWNRWNLESGDRMCLACHYIRDCTDPVDQPLCVINPPVFVGVSEIFESGILVCRGHIDWIDQYYGVTRITEESWPTKHEAISTHPGTNDLIMEVSTASSETASKDVSSTGSPSGKAW